MTNGRVTELDGLRGIACGMIVTLHCIMMPLDYGIAFPLRAAIAPLVVGGVDLFFVLSGFLIGGMLMDVRGSENYFRVFYARRILRIFPVYFLLLSTYMVVLALGSGRQAFDVWLLAEKLPTWSYFFFVQNHLMAWSGHLGSLWMGITWTLAVEEQFYLVVPLIILLLTRKQLIRVALACVALAAVLRHLPGATYTWNYFFTGCRMDSLMAGIFVACVARDDGMLNFCRTWRRALDTGALVLIVTLITWAIADRIAFSMLAAIFGYGILRIFLTDAGLYRSTLRLRGLVWLGGISYPLYMYHQAVNGLMHGLIFGDAPYIGSLAELAVAAGVVAIAVALSALSTRYFERPFRLIGWGLKYKPATAAASRPSADSVPIGL